MIIQRRTINYDEIRPPARKSLLPARPATISSPPRRPQFTNVPVPLVCRQTLPSPARRHTGAVLAASGGTIANSAVSSGPDRLLNDLNNVLFMLELAA